MIWHSNTRRLLFVVFAVTTIPNIYVLLQLVSLPTRIRVYVCLHTLFGLPLAMSPFHWERRFEPLPRSHKHHCPTSQLLSFLHVFSSLSLSFSHACVFLKHHLHCGCRCCCCCCRLFCLHIQEAYLRRGQRPMFTRCMVELLDSLIDRTNACLADVSDPIDRMDDVDLRNAAWHSFPASHYSFLDHHVFWVHTKMVNRKVKLLMPKDRGELIPIFFVVFLICIYVVFELYVILPSIYNNVFTYKEVCHLVFGLYVIFNLVGNLFLCMITDTSIDTIICPVLLPSATVSQVTPNGEQDPNYFHFNWHYCHRCEVNAPPRSQHCHLCKKCILKRDHHCSFLGRCIGFRNIRYYMCFLMWTWVSHLYLLIGLATYEWWCAFSRLDFSIAIFCIWITHMNLWVLSRGESLSVSRWEIASIILSVETTCARSIHTVDSDLATNYRRHESICDTMHHDISRRMIQRWCEALRDRCLLHSDSLENW